MSRNILSLLVRGHPSIENKGSVVRDHLANERTFLSWTRTALSLVFLGLGLERFETLREDITRVPLLELASTPTGAVTRTVDPPATSLLSPGNFSSLSPSKKISLLLSATGGVIAVQSTWRYFSVMSELQKNGTNHFKPNIRGVTFIAASSLGLMVAVMSGHSEQVGRRSDRKLLD